MSRITLFEGLFLNLAGRIEATRREYLPREDAYAKLKQLSGQDFGYDVKKWQEWFRGEGKPLRIRRGGGRKEK